MMKDEIIHFDCDGHNITFLQSDITVWEKTFKEKFSQDEAMYCYLNGLGKHRDRVLEHEDDAQISFRAHRLMFRELETGLRW